MNTLSSPNEIGSIVIAIAGSVWIVRGLLTRAAARRRGRS